MANLRADLLNELRNQKYYAEIELVRLAQDATMSYRDKIDSLDELLGDIALLNNKMGLADGYFQEPQAAPVPAPEGIVQSPEPMPVPEGNVEAPVAQPAPAPQPIVHQGQSHGE